MELKSRIYKVDGCRYSVTVNVLGKGSEKELEEITGAFHRTVTAHYISNENICDYIKECTKELKETFPKYNFYLKVEVESDEKMVEPAVDVISFEHEKFSVTAFKVNLEECDEQEFLYRINIMKDDIKYECFQNIHDENVEEYIKNHIYTLLAKPVINDKPRILKLLYEYSLFSNSGFALVDVFDLDGFVTKDISELDNDNDYLSLLKMGVVYFNNGDTTRYYTRPQIIEHFIKECEVA